MALPAPAIPADAFLVGQAATDKSLKPSVTVSIGWREFDVSRCERIIPELQKRLRLKRTGSG